MAHQEIVWVILGRLSTHGGRSGLQKAVA